jgi:hypothetical protein
MQPEVLATSTSLPFEETYTLIKSVSAIPIISAEDGSRRLGLITQLPEGVQIEMGGPGFNDRTIKVRCGGTSFFIFLEDLELNRKPASLAVVA